MHIAAEEPISSRKALTQRVVVDLRPHNLRSNRPRKESISEGVGEEEAWVIVTQQLLISMLGEVDAEALVGPLPELILGELVVMCLPRSSWGNLLRI